MILSRRTALMLGLVASLASQGKQLVDVALVMLTFGVGAALPLLGLGLLSREAALRLRGRLMNAGRGLRLGMGAVLVLIGVGILSGSDKRVETWLVEMSPAWLTALTTSI